MTQRSSIQTKQEILAALSETERTVRQLARRVGTGDRTIRHHVAELVLFNCVLVEGHEAHAINGRPYATARITDDGLRLLERLRRMDQQQEPGK